MAKRMLCSARAVEHDRAHEFAFVPAEMVSEAAPQLAARRLAARKWTTRGVLVLALAGGAAVLPRLTAKKPVSVKTVRVERATVRDVVTSSTAGEVVPARHATVRAELAARVMAVKHTRGDRVRAGETIVVLDAADLEARIAQAQATVAAQEAALAQAKARVVMTQQNAARTRTLAERGAGTTQAAEDADALARADAEAVHSAQALLNQSQAALKVARVARDKATISAPFDGLLVDERPDPGEELSPGTPVFEIIDDRSMHVEATVDEADAAKVRLGQAATLTLDALPDQTIAGRVSKLGPAVRKDAKGARMLPIDVEVADAAAAGRAGLRSGMSANVEIVVSQKPDVVSLPTNVIVGRGAKRTVFAIIDGHARVRPVEVGLSNWDKSEIVSGLALGAEVVATLNNKELEDGVPVVVAATP
jgi:HlyD family secretion protein